MKELFKNPGAVHVVINPRTGKKYALPRFVKAKSYTVADLVPVEDLPQIASAADEASKAYEKRNQAAIRRRKQRTGRNPLTLRTRPLTKVVDDNFIDKFLGKISNVFNE